MKRFISVILACICAFFILMLISASSGCISQTQLDDLETRVETSITDQSIMNHVEHNVCKVMDDYLRTVKAFSNGKFKGFCSHVFIDTSLMAMTTTTHSGVIVIWMATDGTSDYIRYERRFSVVYDENKPYMLGEAFLDGPLIPDEKAKEIMPQGLPQGLNWWGKK